MKKILIAAPVRQTEQIFKLYLQSLRNLIIPEGYEVHKLFYLHNCEDLKRFTDSKKKEKVFIKNNLTEYIAEDHIWSQNNLNDVVKMKNEQLKYAKDNYYDYIFYVDSDLLLQPQTLEVLLNADKDIISEVFWTVRDVKKSAEPNCWDYDNYVIVASSLNKWLEPGLYPVGMTGACTLIKSKVIYSGVNWSVLRNVSFTIWEDKAFCVRALAHNFEIWIDTHFPATHLYRQKDLDDHLNETNCSISKSDYIIEDKESDIPCKKQELKEV